LLELKRIFTTTAKSIVFKALKLPVTTGMSAAAPANSVPSLTADQRARWEIGIALNGLLPVSAVVLVGAFERVVASPGGFDTATRIGLSVTAAYTILMVFTLSLDWLQPDRRRADLARAAGLKRLNRMGPALVAAFGAGVLL
jgi:hypothetical protein